MRVINLREAGTLGTSSADPSAAKTRRANGGTLWPQGRANPAQEHEDRRFATRPLVAARFRKEAVLTLFESVTYLFVPAGTRIPYCRSVTAWAARFFEKKRGSAFLCSPNQSPPLSNRPLACYFRGVIIVSPIL